MGFLFYRKNAGDKWHWYESCSHFPKSSLREIKFLDNMPDPNESCKECERIGYERQMKYIEQSKPMRKAAVKKL